MLPLAIEKPCSTPRKVIHFVTGGFSGATQVAVELVRACKADPNWEVMLVGAFEHHPRAQAGVFAVQA